MYDSCHNVKKTESIHLQKSNPISKYGKYFLKYINCIFPGSSYNITHVLKCFISWHSVWSPFSLHTCAPHLFHVNSVDSSESPVFSTSRNGPRTFFSATKQKEEETPSLYTPNAINNWVLSLYYLNVSWLCFTSVSWWLRAFRPPLSLIRFVIIATSWPTRFCSSSIHMAMRERQTDRQNRKGRIRWELSQTLIYMHPSEKFLNAFCA